MDPMTIVHLLEIVALFLTASALVSAVLFATLAGLARLEVATVPVRTRGVHRRGHG